MTRLIPCNYLDEYPIDFPLKCSPAEAERRWAVARLLNLDCPSHLFHRSMPHNDAWYNTMFVLHRFVGGPLRWNGKHVNVKLRLNWLVLLHHTSLPQVYRFERVGLFVCVPYAKVPYYVFKHWNYHQKAFEE